MDEDQEQAIGELEAFAVLVAFHLWRQKLAKKHVVVFLDNEGCRFLVLKGYASNQNLQDSVFAIANIELEWCIFPWYAWVPTECNLADFPSREKRREVLSPTLRVDLPEFKEIWKTGF